MAIVAVINVGSSAYAQKNAIVNYQNPIVLDSGYGGHEGHLIMSIGLSTNDRTTWFFQGFKIEDVEKTSLIEPGDQDSSFFSIYDLKELKFYVNGIPTGERDSIIPGQNLISQGAFFAAGTHFEVKARFPENKNGVLRMKIMLSFRKSQVLEYEKYEYVQTVYRGIKPDTSTSSVFDLKLSQIIMCQNMDERTIVLKNFPVGETLRVYDPKGSLIYESIAGKIEETIDFENLPINTYYIKIGDAFYKKVIM